MAHSLNGAAFTLIELSAVLALMAVIAAVAAVSLAGPRRRAAADGAVGQVTFADAQARQATVAGDQPQVLVIDLAVGRLSRSVNDGPPTTLADLPGDVRVQRVRLGSDVVDFGQVRVPVSAAGRSPSYAVGLSTPAGPRWLVVAGLTGQVTAVTDDAEAEAVLEPTRGE